MMGNKYYKEGFYAFEDGLDYTQNPYSEGSAEAIQWREGWNAAEQEDLKFEDKEE